MLLFKIGRWSAIKRDSLINSSMSVLPLARIWKLFKTIEAHDMLCSRMALNDGLSKCFPVRHETPLCSQISNMKVAGSFPNITSITASTGVAINHVRLQNTRGCVLHMKQPWYVKCTFETYPQFDVRIIFCHKSI